MIADIVSLSEIGKNDQLRTDVKYSIFSSTAQWKVFPRFEEHILISDLLTELPIRKVKKGDLEQEALIINIPDQIPNLGRLVVTDEMVVSSVGSDKNVLTDSDIMISKLGMSRGYIYLNEVENIEVIGSTEFIPYKINEKYSKYKKVIVYFLLLPELREVYSFLQTGKTPSHQRVNPSELLKIKIPKLDDEKLDLLNEEILKTEKIMEELDSQKAPMHEILNKVFAEEFNFNSKLYYSLGKGMTYPTRFSDDKQLRVSNVQFDEIAKNTDLRLSVRVNNDISYQLVDIIENINTDILRNNVLEPITRGSAPKYSSDGEIPVLKTAHLKNSKIEKSEEYVSEAYYSKYPAAQVKNGDILIASTGKGSLGKVDIVTDESKYFADSHLTIIRIDEKKYNKLFILYWLRSLLGIYQMEAEYTGSTNQIELNTPEIEEFKIPRITLDKQIEIVKKINDEYKNQRKYDREFKNKRKDIVRKIVKVIHN